MSQHINDQTKFRGVVEDNNDPEKIGRVKVRIVGIHTSSNENSGEPFAFTATTDLPWAEVMGGTEFGLVSGVGLSSVLRKGSWVWVFLEGGDSNKPIVIGTVRGINSESSVSKYADGSGFFDPDGTYPFESRSAESDINRLARNEKLSDPYYDSPCPILGLDTTIHQKITDTLDENTGISDTFSGADVSQSEPQSLSSSALYPDSQILETASGHVVEMDDTAGNERIRVYHRTGSYIEVRPDGTFVQKSVNEDSASHYIHMSSVEEHVKKSVKTYIEENLDEIIKGDVKRHVEKNLKEHISMAVDRKIEGTLTEEIVGNTDRTMKGTLTENTTGDITRNSTSGNLIEDISGTITVDAGGNVTWTIGGSLTITASSGVTVDGGPSITMTGGAINLN